AKTESNKKALLVEAEDWERQSLAMRRRKLKDENSSEVAASLHNLGLIQRDEDKLAEAETQFRDALRAGRNAFSDNHLNVARFFRSLVDVLVRQKKFAEVEAVSSTLLTPALTNKPQAALLFRTRGVARARATHWTDAAADFTRVIELAPDDPEDYES